MADVEMKDLSEIRGRLQFDYPDAPPAMLDDAIICAAQELTAKPLIEQTYDLSDQLQKSEGDYSFKDHLPKDLELSQVRAVSWCGCCLEFTDPKCDPCPRGWSLCGRDAITIHPAPDAITKDTTLTVCITLRPSSDACTLPCLLIEDHWRVLRDLARVELSLAPNQEWTDERYAQYLGRRTRSAVQKAQRGAATGRKENPRRRASGSRWLI